MKALLIIRLIGGVIVAVAFFAAGQEMMRAGRFMDIQSIGGQTLEEAFYQAYGLFAQAVGVATMALGGLALVVSLPTNWPTVVKDATASAAWRPEAPRVEAAEPNAPPRSEPASVVAEAEPRRVGCVRCGFSLPQDADFCPQCGVRQRPDAGRPA